MPAASTACTVTLCCPSAYAPVATSNVSAPLGHGTTCVASQARSPLNRCCPSTKYDRPADTGVVGGVDRRLDSEATSEIADTEVDGVQEVRACGPRAGSGDGPKARTRRTSRSLRRLYRPRGLQEALWLDHLPRVDGGRVPDYVQQVTAEQFGAMVPTATTLVGDDGGVLLGHTTGGLRAPVLYDVTAPPRESRARRRRAGRDDRGGEDGRARSSSR